MKVTFQNKLKIVKSYEGLPRIEYIHGQPCDLKMYIEKRKPVTEPGQKAHDIDWKIILEGGTPAKIEECRKELSSIFSTYIQRRTRKKSLKDVSFKMLESLSETKSIETK